MQKKYFIQKIERNFHIEITSIVTEFITLQRLYNFDDIMLSANGIGEFYNQKTGNLMILDNYERMCVIIVTIIIHECCV